MEIEHRDALRAAVGTLDRLGVEHFLFDGNAQNVWGDPRYTKDADLIINLPEERFAELLGALAEVGFKVVPETHSGRLQRNRMVKLGFGMLSVDFVLGETEFDRIAMERRRRTDYLGMELWVVSPEDLILYKLIAHRPLDVADIEKVIRRQRGKLDRKHLGKWARWLARETGLKHIETTLGTKLRDFGTRRRPSL